MPRTLPRLVLLACTCAVSACASIVGEGEQEITVDTTPVGAVCHLSNSRGDWLIESTPGSVVVPRGFEPLALTCKKTGYLPANQLIEARTRDLAYGNILLGGFPAYVDASTGKGYEYTPDVFQFTLEEDKAGR